MTNANLSGTRFIGHTHLFTRVQQSYSPGKNLRTVGNSYVAPVHFANRHLVFVKFQKNPALLSRSKIICAPLLYKTNSLG